MQAQKAKKKNHHHPDNLLQWEFITFHANKTITSRTLVVVMGWTLWISLVHCPTSPSNSEKHLTYPAGVEPSSKCAGKSPPCEIRVGICRTTEQDVWTEEHPVSPGTQLPPVPLVVKSLRRRHTVPSLGTVPHTEVQLSTHDRLQHSPKVRTAKR